ncbi:uncharacterized protein [Nicotiana sylvestris]|uniref:uncharacterized protein n=1 Tax=Nicotiana sylvestris TaxID=4096 RepID=UPI00388CB378
MKCRKPLVAANNFEIRIDLIQTIQQSCIFTGDLSEDLHSHLIDFLELVETAKYNGVPPEAIKLTLFPFSLKGEAKTWLQSLPQGSITTWDQMTQKFLNKYFSPAKTTKLRQDISNFLQIDTESVYQTWERLKTMLRKCLHHDIPEHMQLYIFYLGLKPSYRNVIDAVAGGSIMGKTTEEAMQLLNKISENAIQWTSEHVIIKKAATVNQVDVSNTLTQQIVSLAQKFESFQNFNGAMKMELKTLKTTKRNRPHQQTTPYQQRPQQGHPSLDDLLYKYIKVTDEKMESQNSALKNLEIHLSQLATLVSEKIQGPLPSNTERNPKEHLNVIALRSVLYFKISYYKNLVTQKLDLGEMKDTGVSLQFADQSTKRRKGIIENVLVRVDKFYFLVDFIVLEMKECPDEPIILGRSFLATGRAIIDVHQGQLILRVDEERVIFYMEKILRFSEDDTSSSCFSIDMINNLIDEFKDDQLISDSMERCLAKSGTTQDEDPTIRSDVKLLEKDYEEGDMQLEEVQPKIELKTLPSHLKYVYLEHELFPVIISSSLTTEQEERLIELQTDSPTPKEIKPSNAGNGKKGDYKAFDGYNQIPIAPEDQDRTTFTCPHGTYAYRRMPFGLCNASATFQRCMSAIFSDMTEKFHEIFMDDFTLFGKGFEDCLHHLTLVFKRCEETNLIFNWKKCHFMVTEGIILGHKITAKGIEVDKAKINLIAGLPPPIAIKGIRNFLGHAGFYRRLTFLGASTMSNNNDNIQGNQGNRQLQGNPQGNQTSVPSPRDSPRRSREGSPDGSHINGNTQFENVEAIDEALQKLITAQVNKSLEAFASQLPSAPPTPTPNNNTLENPRSGLVNSGSGGIPSESQEGEPETAQRAKLPHRANTRGAARNQRDRYG